MSSQQQNPTDQSAGTRPSPEEGAQRREGEQRTVEQQQDDFSDLPELVTTIVSDIANNPDIMRNIIASLTTAAPAAPRTAQQQEQQQQQQRQTRVAAAAENDSDNEDGRRPGNLVQVSGGAPEARDERERRENNTNELIPEQDSDEEREFNSPSSENDGDDQDSTAVRNGAVRLLDGTEVSFVLEGGVPIEMQGQLLSSVLNNVQQHLENIVSSAAIASTSSSSSSPSPSASPSSAGSPASNWDIVQDATAPQNAADDVRIRVPLRFLDSSATSSGAPTATQQQQEDARQQRDEQRSRHRADATSETTTASTQTTPDTNPPLRPEPLFSAELRQQRLEQERQQRQDQPLRNAQRIPQRPQRQPLQHQQPAHAAHRNDEATPLLDPIQMLQQLMQSVDGGNAGPMMAAAGHGAGRRTDRATANALPTAAAAGRGGRPAAAATGGGGGARRDPHPFFQQNFFANDNGFGGGGAGERCDHDIHELYDNLYDVPICVCELCEQAIIVPKDQNEYTATALRFPHSMQRDNRFQELFELHREHLTIAEDVQEILKKQRALYLRLFEWENRYSDRAPINYHAQNNPCYRELSRSVDRYVNALQAFSNVSQEMTLAHRRRFVKTVYRTFPKNKAFFQSEMRYEICKAQPNPMLLPGIDALPDCTVCGKAADVRLHAHTQRMETRRMPHALRSDAVQQVPLRQCVCKNFLMCLDCLLDWFWESSARLEKSFAACPTCKAEFKLEDILRVCVAPASHAGGANHDQAAAATATATTTPASAAAAAAAASRRAQ